MNNWRRELAAFEGKEDACLLNYGYQGMVSIIDVLCSRHDVIVYDAESHACIIDGVSLAPRASLCVQAQRRCRLRKAIGASQRPSSKNREPAASW
jgi:7-keto-8-aminopelargonate synthetase-like enzyme